MLRKNDDIIIKIDSLTSEGSGVGRHDGLAVFVNGTAVGDTVKAHIIKVKSSYAVGTVKEVITPSPDRVEPDCEVYARCGGCCFRHIAYSAQCDAKKSLVENAFSRLGHISIDVEQFIGAHSPDFYRNKAQLPVGTDADGNVVTGFYSQRSHRIIPCTSCRLQPDVFNRISEVFNLWAKLNKVSVYNESTGKGILRHLYIRQASATGEIMVCPVINADRLPHADDLITALTDTVKEIVSVVVNVNKKNTNVILGEKCTTLYGRDYIEDILCSVRVRISPLSFYQVNRDQAEKLYTKAAEYAGLTGEETLLDLYCGAGTIGLSMASKVKQLIGVEIIPEAVEDAKLNAQLNGITNARFICADAEKAAQELEKEGLHPDVIVLDPPRKGCAPQLIDTVVRFAPDRIVYVSCDPATLARDCGLFEKHGYSVKRLSAVDMFPQTSHVESVVLMSRSGS